jgi:hypothetical protein
MPLKEATFWYGTILFTTGSYFWIQPGGTSITVAVMFTVIGLAMSVYAVIAEHYPIPKLRLWVGLLLLTWAGLGYDAYVHRAGLILKVTPVIVLVGGILALILVSVVLSRTKPKQTPVEAPTDKPKEPSKLVIHSADYCAWNGAGERFDVTAFMRKAIAGNSLVHGPIENHSFSIEGKNYVPRDPLFGQTKRLQVTYSYDGEAQRTVRRTEHGRITLPEDSVIDWLGSELQKAKVEAGKWEQKYTGSESNNHAIRDLIGNDAANLQSRIRQHKQNITFHFGPSSDPYVDVVTELWNGSVFDLVSTGQIAGHVTYVGKQLAGDPRVMVSVEPPLLNLRHGESVTLVVRQYLSSQVADAMVAGHGRGIAIDFQSVFASFKVLPLDGTMKMDVYRWQGPRFVIEDAERI